MSIKDTLFSEKDYDELRNDEFIVVWTSSQDFSMKHRNSNALAEISVWMGQHNEYIFDIRHVFTPFECRGQGLAAKVVDKAMALAVHKNAKVVPTCTYVSQTYLPKIKGECCTNRDSSGEENTDVYGKRMPEIIQ
jgi:predicted GNAT family acetyltransferase